MKVEDIEVKVDGLQNDLSKLTTKVDQWMETVNQLQSQLTQLSKKVTTVKQEHNSQKVLSALRRDQGQ